MLAGAVALPLGVILALVITIATVARVYRGGTTLNDHAVALVVTGCVAVYPVLWGGLLGSGVADPARALIGLALLAGMLGIYALFHVLDGRRDPGALIGLARWSQVAYAFSLWTGLLLILRAPVVLASGGGLAELCWPGLWLLLPLGLAGWGAFWTYARGETVREQPIPLPTLTGQELRVVHLSDLHVGPTMRARELERLFGACNALSPDLVVITGDLLMPYSEREHDFLLRLLPTLRAPVLACAGNHDLPVLDSFKQELLSIGVPLLVDEAQVLTLRGLRVEVVGVNFHWGEARARLLGALDRLPPAPDVHARLLLAHDPRLFRWVPEDRFDLVLSGHTHGGQVGTDMFGLPWSVLRPLGVHDQGFWRKGRALLYVHRGNWMTGLPPRMGIAGEIMLLRLGAPGEVAALPAREDEGARARA